MKGGDKMKRVILLISLLVFLMATPLLGASKEAPIEIKIAHWQPAESKDHQNVKFGADWMEKRFPGRFKITIYPAQTLVNAPTTYESVIKGICDIGVVVPGITKGRFPKTEVIELPPNPSSAVDATRVYWEFYDKFLKDEWRETKVLSLYVQNPQGLQHSKKPIRTFEDLKGEKIRTYGLGKDIMTAFGGTAVAVPIPEAYEALRQGVISGIMVPTCELIGYRFIDVTFYHTPIDVLAAPFFMVMNLSKYNSLPPDIKKAFDEELPAYWNMEAAKNWDRWEEMGKDLARKTKGHQLIILSPDERRKWRERAMTINGPWASALEARGLPGKKLLEEKLSAIQKYIK